MTTLVFSHKSASLSLKTRDGFLLLTNLYSIKPGNGHATELMGKVEEYADQHKVVIKLIAKQYGNARGLNNDQLVTFYKKFGFIQNGSEMIRQPQDLHRV
jgi:hypothetical protein